MKDTISTIKEQTYSNWEVWFVNDCSTDKSEEIIKKYLADDKRINLISLTENSGAAVARNIGIKNANGRYIAFLDSDDLWMKEKLETQVKVMKKNNYSFTYTNYGFTNEDGAKNGKIVNVPKSLNYKQALRNTTIFTSTVMFDCTQLGKELCMMPNVRRGQDTATWWKVLKTGVIAHGICEELSLYRRSSNTLSSNKIKALKRTWNLYRNIEKFNIAYSSYCFLGYVFNAIKRRI